MSDPIEELKSVLHASGIEWSSLYEQGVKTKPYYFGIYKTVYKPGFETAEKLYAKRLQDLVNYIDNIDACNPRTRQCIDKIRTYHEAFNRTVDFNSEAFRNGCRDLTKPLRRLSRLRKYTVKNTVVRDSLVSDGDRKVLAKLCYQLNPYNYFYPYLTHFFYVTDEGVNTLLINDDRRKQVRRLDARVIVNNNVVRLERRLDAIGELIFYISGLEIPRRKHRTALSFRYIIYENNPGKICNETLVYSAVNFAVMSGFGTLDAWKKNSKGKWKCIKTFDHWRR